MHRHGREDIIPNSEKNKKHAQSLAERSQKTCTIVGEIMKKKRQKMTCSGLGQGTSLRKNDTTCMNPLQKKTPKKSFVHGKFFLDRRHPSLRKKDKTHDLPSLSKEPKSMHRHWKEDIAPNRNAKQKLDQGK